MNVKIMITQGNQFIDQNTTLIINWPFSHRKLENPTEAQIVDLFACQQGPQKHGVLLDAVRDRGGIGPCIPVAIAACPMALLH